MTISSTTVKNSYSGDGSQTTFVYGYKIFANTDIKVIIRSAAGTETVRFSRNFAGTETATNGTEVHTLVFADREIGNGEINTSNMHFLSFLDLTGCYLVGEEVKRHIENFGTPLTINTNYDLELAEIIK